MTCLRFTAWVSASTLCIIQMYSYWNHQFYQIQIFSGFQSAIFLDHQQTSALYLHETGHDCHICIPSFSFPCVRGCCSRTLYSIRTVIVWEDCKLMDGDQLWSGSVWTGRLFYNKWSNTNAGVEAHSRSPFPLWVTGKYRNIVQILFYNVVLYNTREFLKFILGSWQVCIYKCVL